jgi:hypothetical protein
LGEIVMGSSSRNDPIASIDSRDAANTAIFILILGPVIMTGCCSCWIRRFPISRQKVGSLFGDILKHETKMALTCTISTRFFNKVRSCQNSLEHILKSVCKRQ